MINDNALIWSLKRRSIILLAITGVSVVFAAAIVLSTAGMGSFDPSSRAISDPVEGTETQAVENPARPEHPGFPPPSSNNLSLSSGTDGNISIAAQGLLEPLIAKIVFLGVSK